jgi:hypothetical protein
MRTRRMRFNRRTFEKMPARARSGYHTRSLIPYDIRLRPYLTHASCITPSLFIVGRTSISCSRIIVGNVAFAG